VLLTPPSVHHIALRFHAKTCLCNVLDCPYSLQRAASALASKSLGEWGVTPSQSRHVEAVYGGCPEAVVATLGDVATLRQHRLRAGGGAGAVAPVYPDGNPAGPCAVAGVRRQSELFSRVGLAKWTSYQVPVLFGVGQ
jgi:hypothetical protein